MVAGQNLAGPNTWTSSALQALKQLHEQLMQHYNCKEWFRHQTPMLQSLALLNSTRTLALFPFLPLTLSLLCVFGRMWKTATPMLTLHCPCNDGSPNRSCESGTRDAAPAGEYMEV